MSAIARLRGTPVSLLIGTDNADPPWVLEGAIAWAEVQLDIEPDAGVLLLPDHGPLALTLSWRRYVEAIMDDGLLIIPTTDGLTLWVATCP